ncbi:MAG: hypothetical protein COZ06_02350 [Armatimonadetes bacterium CG_4_10_14_3_um_filter_66_18]|nr:MAG: hypothetical protein AUJ96_02710 [Armatimonadetes bacterium CG2_30_66_41]PIX36897.1 MAG: hypothetical protein COZ57_37110 [Armatimonadetes bacterium CG_4_8_14_3_um_filter_66_20]PIY52954.1 MAG: hypothetical protein COZ06_02350 [Armatimonadetes bacterium CG_4_10_14_3_um_filter_66_18]
MVSIDAHPCSGGQILWDLENGIALPDKWCAAQRANRSPGHLADMIACNMPSGSESMVATVKHPH